MAIAIFFQNAIGTPEEKTENTQKAIEFRLDPMAFCLFFVNTPDCPMAFFTIRDYAIENEILREAACRVCGRRSILSSETR
jgi:hypothetical protein